MRRSLGYLSYLSLVLNLMFIGSWIIVFYKHNNHNDRVREYDMFLPSGFSANYYSLALILLTILSIIGFAQSNSWINKILLITQVLLLALLVFGLL
jgi:hypothetical protein